MKKMIMFLTAIMLTAVIHAASFNWTCSGIKVPEVTGAFSESNINGALAYLFLGTPNQETITGALQAGTFNSIAQTAAASTKIANGAIKPPVAVTCEVGSVDAYMVIFNKETIEGSEFFMISDKLTKEVGTAGRTLFNFKDSLPTEWTSTAVPEPTSIALLVLGLAAFGIRRKVRA